MKKVKVVAMLLLFSILSPSLSIYAEGVTLNKILAKINKPQLTSLQKLNMLEDYKGKRVRGVGRVKDVIQSPTSRDEALVYLKKRFKNINYEIVLTVSRESAQKIGRRRIIKFEGDFIGISVDTLRFKNVKLMKKGWLPF